MDKTKSPNFIPPINIMRLESLKEDNLYTGDKPLEFIGPKVSVVQRFHSTLYVGSQKAMVRFSTNSCNDKFTCEELKKKK